MNIDWMLLIIVGVLFVKNHPFFGSGVDWTGSPSINDGNVRLIEWCVVFGFFE